MCALILLLLYFVYRQYYNYTVFTRTCATRQRSVLYIVIISCADGTPTRSTSRCNPIADDLWMRLWNVSTKILDTANCCSRQQKSYTIIIIIMHVRIGRYNNSIWNYYIIIIMPTMYYIWCYYIGMKLDLSWVINRGETWYDARTHTRQRV